MREVDGASIGNAIVEHAVTHLCGAPIIVDRMIDFAASEGTTYVGGGGGVGGIRETTTQKEKHPISALLYIYADVRYVYVDDVTAFIVGTTHL